MEEQKERRGGWLMLIVAALLTAVLVIYMWRAGADSGTERTNSAVLVHAEREERVYE